MNELTKIDALYGTNDDGAMYRPQFTSSQYKGGLQIECHLLPDDWRYDSTATEYDYAEFVQLTAEEHDRVLKVMEIASASIRVDRGALAYQLRFADHSVVIWCTQRRVWMTFREWQTSTTPNQFRPHNFSL